MSNQIDPTALYLLSDSTLQDKKEKTVSELKWLIDEANQALTRLERGGRAGLLGGLQNTWSLFRAAAEYDQLLELQEEIKSIKEGK